MLFNTLQFGVFFALFLICYYLLAPRREHKIIVIILGSLVFYGSWDYRFIPFLLGTSLFDFYVARKLDSESDQKKRVWLLRFSILVNLGLLGYFKYANFFVQSGYGIFERFGFASVRPPIFDILLPIGISFYTFQSMSYVIDVYRKEFRARTKPFEFVAGVLFFPHLVAGPIVRAKSLLPQLESLKPRVPLHIVQRAVLIFALGLFKKGFGDLLAVYSDKAFLNPHTTGFLGSWVGTLAFMGQDYSDFSGYTDMAIGSALLLGIELPVNFRQPFLAKSIPEFWQRWHISLTQWFRDYVFTPLGGVWRHPYRNLVFVFLLSGLWHGANWTFVIWGGIYGVILAVALFSRKHTPRISRAYAKLPVIVQIGFTFYLSDLITVFFRSTSVRDAILLLETMHRWPADFGEDAGLQLTRLAFVVSVMVTCHAINLLQMPDDRSEEIKTWKWIATGLILALGLTVNGAARAFVYFQF